MRTLIASIACATLLIGCSGDASAPTGGTAAKQASTADAGAAALLLTGPGGKVAIGDALAAAKAAFPAPEGAHEFDQSMNFAILGKEGWAWADDSGLGFEVALEDGKIIAFARTEMGKAMTPQIVEPRIATIGGTFRKAVGKTVDVYVWESGENARFFVVMRSGGVLGEGAMTLVGRKSDLAVLNYRAEDPETFVKQMDSGAEAIEKMKGK